MDIVVAGLGKAFPQSEGLFWALRDLDIEIRSGETLCVVGPTGCGKTTLLRLISGLVEPTLGDVRVGKLTPNEARKRAEFSFVFQNPALLPWRTVEENIRLPSEIVLSECESVPDLLRLVSLNDFAGFLPKELSGGMRQRAALARALSFRPSILLMDEPFGALDEQTRARLNSELLRITGSRKVTVVFVTHSISEAVFVGDRVAVLTSAPAKAKRIFKISFGDRRTIALRDSQEFQAKVREVREEL